jgi:hypothetical protein
MKVVKRGKLTRYTPRRGLVGKAGIALLFLNLSKRRGWVVRMTLRPQFTAGEGTPGTNFIGGWVGPRAGWAQRVEKKSSFSVGYQTPVAQSSGSHYIDRATGSLPVSGTDTII